MLLQRFPLMLCVPPECESSLCVLPPSQMPVLSDRSSPASPSLLHLMLFLVHAGKSPWILLYLPRPPPLSLCFVVSVFLSWVCIRLLLLDVIASLLAVAVHVCTCFVMLSMWCVCVQSSVVLFSTVIVRTQNADWHVAMGLVSSPRLPPVVLRFRLLSWLLLMLMLY